MLAFALPLAGATAAIFLAGGASQGNLGVFLLCAGGALVLCPPRCSVGRVLPAVAAAFVGCGALALLPERLFPEPVWRRWLATVPISPLPDTVSAAPDQTRFWLGILVVTTLLGVFLLTQPVRSRGLLALALAGAGVCGAYAALSIFAKFSGWVYPFGGGASFGFLPNRNHTATLLLTGSLLALGTLGVTFRERRWLAADAAVAALCLCVAGLLFFSESRAGVVLLLVGVGGWLAGLGGRHRAGPLLLAVAAGLVLVAGVFLSVRSDARDRLFQSASRTAERAPAGGSARDGIAPAPEITNEGRLNIYRDALGLIRDVPLTGVGLGTFSLVFTPYRKAAANSALILHPESDWLMVAAEMGLPACLCLAALAGLALRAWRPDRGHPYWPLRWGVFMAGLMGVMHGLMDVPAHRAAVGWWVLTLLALALQPGRVGEDAGGRRTGRLARGIFILGGVFSLALGTRLVRAEWFGGAPLPPYVAEKAQAAILRRYNQGEVQDAMEDARLAVRRSPLSSPLYYQLGVLLLRFDGTDDEVDRAFASQRILNPFYPDVPRSQAVAWMPLDPARSVRLFADALVRQERLSRLSVERGGAAAYLGGMVEQAGSVPPVQRLLWSEAAARKVPGMLAWLEAANADVAREKLPGLAADEGFLGRLDMVQRRRFVSVWRGKGDRDALQSFLKTRGASWGL